MTDDDDEELDMAAAMAEMEAQGIDQTKMSGNASDGDDDEGEMDMAAAMAEMEAQGIDQTKSGGGSSGQSGQGTQGSQGTQAGQASAKGGEKTAAQDIFDRAVHDIQVELTAVLGTADMKVSNLLKIGRGAVIELDRRIGDTVEVRVNGMPVARGEVIVVEDHLAVSITEVFRR